MCNYILMWVELFTNLGFFGYYIIWALFIGIIAIFEYKKRNIKKYLFLSWIAGIILVEIGPIISLFAAVFIRLILVSIKTALNVNSVGSLMKENKIIKVKSMKLFNLTILLFFILGAATLIFAPPMEVKWYNMNNAEIKTLDKATLYDVNNIEWEDIKNARLVSQEYALQIPKTMVTETGWKLSNDCDGIYPINNTLYWIMVYEPTTLVNMKNPTPAYIIVNAQNPADRKKIKEEIMYSEERYNIIGLIYQLLTTGRIHDVKIKLWLKYPFFTYGDTVFTHDDQGVPIWFAPAKINFPTPFIVHFYTKQVGVVTMDNKGNTIFYSSKDIAEENAPEWLLKNQVLIDESYTEKRITMWAKYSHWKNFLNYYFQHENVFEQAQNLFFQYDKSADYIYGFVQLEPEGYNRKAITHYVDVEASGKDFGKITINDIREQELIGPIRALNDVMGQISLYSDWYALQPLFREIKGSYFYIVPVYSGTSTSMVLRAVAVVDAKSEQVKLFKWGDLEREEDKTAGNDSIKDKNDAFSFPDCTIISTQRADGKLKIVMECEINNN